jgi:hypothetical protein
MPFEVPDDIRSVVVCNGVMLVATNAQPPSLIRHDMARSDLDTVDLPLRMDSMHKAFLDPRGEVAIVTTTKGDNFVVSSWRSKAERCKKMENVVIESVGWGKGVDPGREMRVLIGSNEGTLYELVLDRGVGKGPDSSRPYQVASFKKVYELPVHEELREKQAICGLQWEKFPPSPSDKADKYLVMLTTPTRLYQYVGGPTFEQLFDHEVYRVNPGFRDLTGAEDVPNAELHFYSKLCGGRSTSFAWLTGQGIYFGNLVFGSQSAHSPEVSQSPQLLSYPQTPAAAAAEAAGGRKIMPSPPLSIAHTEFHFLALYPDRLESICLVNKQRVMATPLGGMDRGRGGMNRFLGLTTDANDQSVWLYSTSSCVFPLAQPSASSE